MKLDPQALAVFGDDDQEELRPDAQIVDEIMIMGDAMRRKEMDPHEAFRFAQKLNKEWNAYDDGSGTLTNGQVVDGAYQEWEDAKR